MGFAALNPSYKLRPQGFDRRLICATVNARGPEVALESCDNRLRQLIVFAAHLDAVAITAQRLLQFTYRYSRVTRRELRPDNNRRRRDPCSHTRAMEPFPRKL